MKNIIMKRSNPSSEVSEGNSQKRRRLNGSTTQYITDEFIEKCKNEFDNDPTNIVARNAVSSIGPFDAAMNVDQENKVNHIFLNTLKPWHLRATNQGGSGRCWMFAGLNIFRYFVIQALDAKDFEFSQTYLFFYDKLERCNTVLEWFIDNPNQKPTDRKQDNITKEFLSDGGWWTYFANLVNKYGLIPKTAMNETNGSWVSNGMNQILNERLLSCASHIRKLQKKTRVTKEELSDAKNQCLQQIYDCLVKHLGKPPEQFDWSYETNCGESKYFAKLTPQKMKEIVMPTFDISDFVVLCNVPGKGRPYYRTFEIKDGVNVQGGQTNKFINLPMHELKKYAKTSILSGAPVWFAGDVSRGFHPYKSALDEDLFDTDNLFGKPFPTTKEERIDFHLTEGNHAMTMVGVNIDENGSPVRWQVENSWGFWDNEVPGMDGFLSMSDQWFENCLIQIVVHKNYLSRNIRNKLNQEPIQLEIWDAMAPALRIKPQGPPQKFNKMFLDKMKNKNYIR